MINNNDIKRYIHFKLQKEIKRKVFVTFICDGFRIDFPLIKDVEQFKFAIDDFTMMLRHGIKADMILQNGNLAVEF